MGKCAKYYPGQVDQCMTCGGTCGRKVCDKNNFWDCVTTAPFKECHRACMTEDASAPEQRPYLRLIRLHRLFSAISQKFWGLVGNVYSFIGASAASVLRKHETRSRLRDRRKAYTTSLGPNRTRQEKLRGCVHRSGAALRA